MENVTSAIPVSTIGVGQNFSTSELDTISDNASRVVDHLIFNTTPIANDSLDSIVYGSREEQVLTIFIFSLVGMAGLCGDAAVIVTIAKSEVLKTIDYGLVLSHALIECIFIINLVYGKVHALLAGGYFWPACEFISPFGMGLYLGLPYHQVVMAYERYMFFCWPMNYNRTITVKKMTCLVVSIYVVTLSYRFMLAAIFGMYFEASVLVCLHPRSVARLSINLSVFFALPLILLILFAVLIGKTTWSAHLAMAVPQGVIIPPPPPILMAKKSVRIILLVSGTFFGIALPSLLVRNAVKNSGFSKEDLNIRVELWPVIIIKVCNMAHTQLSPILHAAINFFCRKQLRTEFQKFTGIGKHSNTVHGE